MVPYLTGHLATRINPAGHNGLFFGNPTQEVINATEAAQLHFIVQNNICNMEGNGLGLAWWR